MQKIIITITLLYTILSCSCQSQTNNNRTKIPSDTTNSFKIGDQWITPKPIFEFLYLVNSASDTLYLVTCGEYVYAPFGSIKNKTDLKTSLLKNFTITKSKLDTFTNFVIDTVGFKQWSESIELEMGPNKLKLFLDNDPEATRHSYISSGEIYDNRVSLFHPVKIGMNRQRFHKIFFDAFPKDLQNKFNIIVFESCVASIKHIFI